MLGIYRASWVNTRKSVVSSNIVYFPVSQVRISEVVLFDTSDLFHSVSCCCSVAKLCLTLAIPWTAAHQASLSFTISQNLLKLMTHWVSDVIQPSHPLLPLAHPALNLSHHEGLFQWVGSSHQEAPRFWSFSISPSSEYSGLIALRIDWFDSLAVQGTLKSLLQHHNSNASILWHSTFFMVQL